MELSSWTIYIYIYIYVSDIQLKERLLREGELSLEWAANFSWAAEETKQQIKDISDKRVHILKKCHKPVGNGKAQPKEGELPFNSVKCDTKDLPKHYLAFGKICHSWKQKGHFSKSKTYPKCKNLRGTRGVPEVTKHGAVGGESKVHDVDFFNGTITAGDKNSAWPVFHSWCGDTSAECCVCPAMFISS